MKIIITGNPVSKNRPRFSRKGTYSDQKAKENEFIIKVLRERKFITPSIKPIELSVIFHLKRPKSQYGTGKNFGKLKKSAPNIHIVKPDIDNLLKFVMDCMNQILWKDDNQVYEISCKKFYSDNPRTELEWWEYYE